MKVAIVGLTSPHVHEFGRILKEKDAEIACVWDYDHNKADLFCCEFRCTAAVDDIEQIADEGLDGVMICSKVADHVRHALPFIAGGVPTMIDEPLGESQADLDRLFEAVNEHGTPMMTSESLKCPSESDSTGCEAAIIDTFLWMCETVEPPVGIKEMVQSSKLKVQGCG